MPFGINDDFATAQKQRTAEAKLHAAAPGNYRIEGGVGTTERMEGRWTNTLAALIRSLADGIHSFDIALRTRGGAQTKLILLIFEI